MERIRGGSLASDSRDNSGAAKRARILQAALQVGELRGVDGARMEEVASLAQVSKGTLYRFFESKHDLFLATIIESYEEGLRIVDTAVDPDSHWQQRLGGRLAALARVLESLGPRMSLHFQAWGVVAGEPGSQERLYGFLRDFHSARGLEIAEDIREGQRAGEFRADVEAGKIAEGIIALLSGFLYRATFDPDAATSGHLHEAFSTFVRGLASDSAPPAAAPRG